MKVFKPRIKICCIMSPDEARMAIGAGADSLGLVSSMPSGPGVISDSKIREVTQIIPPSIDAFVLTALDNSWDLIDLIRKVKNRTIQLVDRLNTGNYQEIRASIPCVKIVQVIHVMNEEAIEQAIRVSSYVDAILLDSGNTELPTKELGGTGKTHDWNISREIVEQVDTPVFLAGGLNPDNVVEAIEIVKPFGVDVCNGVRTNEKLDPAKLKKFIDNVKR
ncbi:MAG: phosphoribosylanthranilate isomerase [Bacteroidetes bacterium]|jgi:phosphoribosylanthranilate isomerase|nr:phosphoribosylanthranilate isomerase [Bacteroidota bacterium]MBT3751692.1 phosphoribosylanthranilate isomerase [Bacteroidota bacterium]MBT4399853.1 phosphoribosylanthranilate isomerase [Bacteroidota bacterium]MBT4410763.1 phosphoribosylanthranilate isomerase [Bacteroidota bacterium]MBT7095492.1 phosphoribosylanthranilate isomerase [Bacteroidota bacterium]